MEDERWMSWKLTQACGEKKWLARQGPDRKTWKLRAANINLIACNYSTLHFTFLFSRHINVYTDVQINSILWGGLLKFFNEFCFKNQKMFPLKHSKKKLASAACHKRSEWRRDQRRTKEMHWAVTEWKQCCQKTAGNASIPHYQFIILSTRPLKTDSKRQHI